MPLTSRYKHSPRNAVIWDTRTRSLSAVRLGGWKVSFCPLPRMRSKVQLGDVKRSILDWGHLMSQSTRHMITWCSFWLANVVLISVFQHVSTVKPGNLNEYSIWQFLTVCGYQVDQLPGRIPPLNRYSKSKWSWYSFNGNKEQTHSNREIGAVSWMTSRQYIIMYGSLYMFKPSSRHLCLSLFAGCPLHTKGASGVASSSSSSSSSSWTQQISGFDRIVSKIHDTPNKQSKTTLPALSPTFQRVPNGC